MSEREVAAYLRVKPCTVANERKAGRLSHTKVGAHIFYTSKHIDEYLEYQEVRASCQNTLEDQDRLARSGQVKNRAAKERVISGSSHGMTTIPDRRLEKALAQRTFKKRS
jgi:hypothetical protein